MKNNVSYKFAVKELLRELHHRIEAKERNRITQATMASRLNVSTRTYLEYLRGTNSPIGMRVVLDMLCMVEDEELTTLIKHWREFQQFADHETQQSTQ